MGTVLNSIDGSATPLLLTGTSGPSGNQETFKRLRQLTQIVTEGVMGSGDLLVSQRGAGANKSVDIAAGYVWIAGDLDTTRTGQFNYGCPLNTATNLDLTASFVAPSGATRRDQIVAHVYDTGDDITGGGGLNKWRVEYIRNASETLTPEAVPSNCVLLAYCDVPVGASSILTAYLTDKRSPSVSVLISPFCRMYRNAAQTVTGPNTYTKIPLDAVSASPAAAPGMADTSNGRILVVSAGLYTVEMQTSSTLTAIYCGKNAGGTISGQADAKVIAYGATNGGQTSRTVRLAAGDTLELFGVTSGASAVVSVGTQGSYELTCMSATRVGD